MISKSTIEKNLDNCLDDTSFIGLPNRKKGKVRDTYDLGDKLVLITTDRQSAFDRILANIPFKGQVLNQVSAFWFEQTRDIVPNHLIDLPDPNATVAKKCRVLPIEFVVRGYLTGSTDTSSWMQYSKGIRNLCGNELPEGMVKNQKFEKPIITPTTKSDLHDESISPREILERAIMDVSTWEKCEEIAFELFDRGTKIASAHGLILVDTKYELGIDASGAITLIDEVHTPDSSRYWLKDTYQDHFEKSKEPENIDKEFLRLWFKDHCDPYKDAVLPEAPKDLVVELSSRYIKLFEMITGKQFSIDASVPLEERLIKNLKRYK
ncbi:MAG: phosphoribosylaminoimidazolesuccinocarboxamide synthase [Chitinivibrionales bacterium]